MTKSMTRKQLCEAAGCTPRVVEYLNNLNKLPKVPSTGLAVYHPDCINIIKEHMKKRG